MTAPYRFQLSRAKGWRMPPNAAKVDRSTRWGNIYEVGLIPCVCRSADCSCNTFRRATAAEAVEAFTAIPRSEQTLADIRVELGGKNLGCWCAIDAPCHGDVLLRLANT